MKTPEMEFVLLDKSARDKELSDLRASLHRIQLEKNAVIERLNEATQTRDEVRRDLAAAREEIAELNIDLNEQDDELDELRDINGYLDSQIRKVELYLVNDVPDAEFIGDLFMSPVEKLLDLSTGRRLEAQRYCEQALNNETEVKRLKELVASEIAFVERLFKENAELRKERDAANAALLDILINP